MSSAVLQTLPLGFPWVTADPFLFCVHHDDAYPAGTSALGPDPALLRGRNLGQDFVVRDGFRMYHGQVVPGFPSHPHRGFETVTIVRRGLIDHSDSLGAAARFGEGDVQWLTAGAGIQHAEMFPLLRPDAPNPVELFQIWLNLPAADKHAPPHFAILWDATIPRVDQRDQHGRAGQITVIAGQLADRRAPSPPPRSWASRTDSDLAIWTVRMEAGATLSLPPARGAESVRVLYFFAGDTVRVGDHLQTSHAAMVVDAQRALTLEAGARDVELLMLQGRPIGEPVAQHGPFVMNTPSEIQQAFADYRRTQFGGWPWGSQDPVHGSDPTRFARHADGRIERVE
jgi:quercetin 2,3-dioxygenase